MLSLKLQLILLNPPYREGGGIDGNPDGMNQDICSGSLLSNKFVLTSADCVLKNKQYNVYNDAVNIHVDLATTTKHVVGYRRQNILKVIPHELAFTDDRKDYNIAILELKDQVYFDDKVRPICLPTRGIIFDYVYQSGIIAGWGGDGSGTWSANLKSANVQIFNKDVCKTIVSIQGKHAWEQIKNFNRISE